MIYRHLIVTLFCLFYVSLLRAGSEDILTELDLSQTGLESVQSAYNKGNIELASEQLLIYMRERFKLQTAKLHKSDKDLADQALRHYFPGNRSNPLVYRGKEIDWLSKAEYEGKTIHDKEWLFQYHRLTWWPSLARTYSATKDKRYFNEWRYELQSYIKSNFPMTRKSPWFVRRGMECESRNRNLMTALAYLIHDKLFTAELLLDVLYMIHHQTEQIRQVYARKGNHLLADLDGVLSSAIAFPEFKKSKEWIAEVLRKYPGLMNSEVFSDGMNKELIFSYHSMYISLFTKFYKKLEVLGLAKDLPGDFKQCLAKMHEIYAHQAYPDMTFCQFGDGWKKHPGSARHMLRKLNLKHFPEDPFYQYLVSDGKSGKAPEPASKAFPVSGFYFLRSAWHKDAIFMPIKANATSGEWHNHIDNGTFGLYAYGRNFMNDSGCYIYGSSDPKDQQWREWFSSSKAHQTMTLNNKNIQLKASCFHWQNDNKLTAVVFENESYEALKHRRTILFIDKRYFIIHDQAIGKAEGTVRVHFQLVPAAIAVDIDKKQVITQFKTGPNLAIQTVVKNAKLLEEEGWISYEQKKKEKRPAWAITVNKTADQTLDFLTVFKPLKEGESFQQPKLTAKAIDGGYSYTIQWPNQAVQSINLIYKKPSEQ